MRIAHYYPGLRLKAPRIKREIAAKPRVQETLHAASAVLDASVPRLCRSNRLYQSSEEANIGNLATCVALGRYYTKRYGVPNIIIGSSFGHYAGLVMARSLEYAETLELVRDQGRAIDRYYEHYISRLVANVPIESLTSLAEEIECRDDIYIFNDGIALSFPNYLQDDVEKHIVRHGGTFRQIPFRVPYHKPEMEEINRDIQPTFDSLNIAPPIIPFMSTFNADTASSPEHIREVLRKRLPQPNLLAKTLEAVNKAGIRNIVDMPPSGDHPQISLVNEAAGRSFPL